MNSPECNSGMRNARKTRTLKGFNSVAGRTWPACHVYKKAKGSRSTWAAFLQYETESWDLRTKNIFFEQQCVHHIVIFPGLLSPFFVL